MKLFITIFMLLTFFTFTAYAGPFLVCDEDPVATSYLVKLDNGDVIITPAPLHYDLAGIDTGDHVIEVRAKNIWGESDPVPFEFRKQLPALPMNFRFQDEGGI